MKHQLNTTQFQKPILEMAFLLFRYKAYANDPVCSVEYWRDYDQL